MRKHLLISLLILPTLAFAKTESWRLEMQKMRASISKLSIFLFSDKEFSNNTQTKEISEGLNYLVKVSDQLDGKIKDSSESGDPAFPYIIEQLKEDLKTGQKAFKEKNYAFAKSTLKSALNRCFQCHTQAYKKTQWSAPHKQYVSKWLSTEEKINYLVAMRDFASAKMFLEERIDGFVSSKESKLEMENILSKYAVVAIRMNLKKEEILSKLEAFYAKLKMKDSLAAKTQKLIESIKDLPDLKDRDSLPKIKKLVSKAENKKEYITDDSALIESLIAAQSLHDLLREKKVKDSEKAEVYFLLGQSYQNINDPAFWDMHENYYEYCVRNKPHSALAKKCFAEFKDSIVFRNTGSAGTNLGLREKLRINQLQKLSK
ncbi:MAG: hypothetical protein VX642_02550 [Bdellovibrionota bacterium]|nr:hypothetical protein [Bdellovibrionota bacterium]